MSAYPVVSLAAAGILLAPAAAAVEYHAAIEGLFAYSVSEYSSDVAGDDSNGHSNGSWAGVDLSAEQAGYRLFGIYQLGFERFNESVPNAVPGDREREFFGGVSSPFGTLGYGRQISFYRQAGQELDPFYDSSVAGFNGVFAAEGASYGLSNLTNGFNDETLAYASPSFHGFTLRASWFMDAASGDDDDYGLGLRYAPDPQGGPSGGIEYLESKGGDAVFGVGKGVDFDAIRVHGSYRWASFSVGASFEQVDVSNEADERKYALISGSFRPMEKLTVAASVGVLKDVVPNAAANPDGIDGEGVSVGVFYEVLPRLTAYVAGRSVNLDSGADSETIAMGASYDLAFELYPGNR